MTQQTAIFKFNGGAGALLCSKCKVIIKIGKDFTEEEKQSIKGYIKLPSIYCEKCKIGISDKSKHMAQQTPKEKAEELVTLYKSLKITTFGCGSETGNPCFITNEMLTHSAKQCSLIAVDEITNTLNYDIRDLDVRGNVLLDLIHYWREVKLEIEKL